ncbi:MAG: membrane protein insertion efficiency factor YidD [Synergistaceae bacterium]|jgi:putative membrane protein insertion efficiency factor|nr:membrane protein insertion efficiency factor YidD [Synergistaceae bacterium]
MPDIPKAAAMSAIKAYRRFLSPLLGSRCRFYPTCSQYALEAFDRHGFMMGFLLTACRLARCGPWHPGGIDRVPDEVSLRKMFLGR